MGHTVCLSHRRFAPSGGTVGSGMVTVEETGKGERCPHAGIEVSAPTPVSAKTKDQREGVPDTPRFLVRPCLSWCSSS